MTRKPHEIIAELIDLVGYRADEPHVIYEAEAYVYDQLERERAMAELVKLAEQSIGNE